MFSVRLATPFFVTALSSSLFSSSPARPAYQSLRFEEDWSRVSEFTDGGDLFDPLKRIPLAAGGRATSTNWISKTGSSSSRRPSG